MTQHAPITTLREFTEAEEPSSLMRSDALQDAICSYLLCGITFAPKKRWQRFCCSEHRMAFHAMKGDGGLRAVVKSNKLLKGGKHSVTLHFEAADDVSQFQPGRTAEIS